jgi:hypothetical protein
LLGRLRLKIGRALVAEAEGGAFTPIVRPRFFFADEREGETIHEVTAVGALVGLGLGGHF